MLVVELKKVVEIDQKISNLHKQLEGLYSIRSSLVSSNNVEHKNKSTDLPSNKLSLKIRNDELASIYDKLSDAWLVHGVKLPSLTQLSKRLRVALDTIGSIRLDSPLIAQGLKVVIVPPKSALDLKKYTTKAVTTQFKTVNYKFAEGVSIQQPKTGWKMLLIYAGKCGVLPEEVDVNAFEKLNLAAYLSLELQEQSVLDTASWTLLPGSPKGSDEIVSVCFNGVSYIFELDDKHNPIGDNRIRPVVEIG